MELKPLDKADLSDLFARDISFDFPKTELKPLKTMLAMMDAGCYEPLLAVRDAEPVGYALCWLPEGQKGALLDYLGVLRGKRNGGLGSEILALLAERYGQLFGEVETPEEGPPDVRELRRRRIGFYERNSFRVLNYDCALFGVWFKCMYRGPETDDCKVLTLHRSVYARWFPPERMERYIQLPLHPGEAVKPAGAWIEEPNSIGNA